MYRLEVSDIIYQTQGRVFRPILKHKEVDFYNAWGAAEIFNIINMKQIYM